MDVGDKRIIGLEAQIDILESLLSGLNADIGVGIETPEIKLIRRTLCAAMQNHARELNEKDQAAKDDRDDMKMEEERGG
ncbi:hypothetical protein LCGC14_1400810 [marine sediment metagenome]|uniref:Uncharacterized protein n=1 Tax=marine sediment metagenome TaxID=412755 RepID=A0A0F9JX57_9ZZZZ